MGSSYGMGQYYPALRQLGPRRGAFKRDGQSRDHAISLHFSIPNQPCLFERVGRGVTQCPSSLGLCLPRYSTNMLPLQHLHPMPIHVSVSSGLPVGAEVHSTDPRKALCRMRQPGT